MSDISDVNAAHESYTLPEDAGRVDVFHGVPDGIDEAAPPELTIHLDVLANPAWTSDDDPREVPRYLYRVTHGDEAHDGELSSVPVLAVLEGALALYTATAQQFVGEFSANLQHQLVGGLVNRITRVHQDFLDVVHNAGESEAWIAELRAKHGDDHDALQADLATHLRALAAEHGVDPEEVEQDLRDLATVFAANSAPEPEES